MYIAKNSNPFFTSVAKSSFSVFQTDLQYLENILSQLSLLEVYKQKYSTGKFDIQFMDFAMLMHASLIISNNAMALTQKLTQKTTNKKLSEDEIAAKEVIYSTAKFSELIQELFTPEGSWYKADRLTSVHSINMFELWHKEGKNLFDSLQPLLSYKPTLENCFENIAANLKVKWTNSFSTSRKLQQLEEINELAHQVVSYEESSSLTSLDLVHLQASLAGKLYNSNLDKDSLEYISLHRMLCIFTWEAFKDSIMHDALPDEFYNEHPLKLIGVARNLMSHNTDPAAITAKYGKKKLKLYSPELELYSQSFVIFKNYFPLETNDILTLAHI